MGNRHETGTEPAPPAIREQLQRVLAQAPFDRAPVLSRFLAHVVEHALVVGAPPLKEYILGVEVFDRPDDFDPRIDTIVRVQARRLRGALAHYYRNQGKHDRIRLDMPKGQYGIRASFRAEDEESIAGSGTAALPSRALPFESSPLPVARTALIGRDGEIRQLAQLLGSNDTRLLTVSGVGGTGKTRLALAVAEALRPAFPGGVLFVDLSPVRERAVLIEQLAEAMEVRHTDGRPLLQVMTERLRNAAVQPLLLVLDNMEGVLEGCDVLGELLDACATLTILVTSRVPLRLYGEHEYPLAPLAIPDAGDRENAASFAAVPSVQLFLARATAANPHVDCSGDVDSLAELCVRLDGLPLAIELVAAQASTLTPRQMLERFTGHLDLPENPARDAPSRQRTLRRVIDWSYELLDQTARIALRRLSVFAGGFTLQAAEAVADSNEDLGPGLMPAIDRLVGMGLLYLRSVGDELRYGMLETLRAYGRERLNASGEALAVRKAHAAYSLVLAEEGLGRLSAAERQAWLASCDKEQDNFRLALDHLLKSGPPRWALRLGQALFTYWNRRERLVEGRRQLERIVDVVPSDIDFDLWARVKGYAGVMAAFHGDRAQAIESYRMLLELYRRNGDLRMEAMSLNALGVTSRFDGDEASARDWFGQALELCRQIGDDREIAATLSNLAECDLKLGNTRAACELLGEARERFVRSDDPLAAAWCVNHLGDVARAEADFEKAADCYERAEAEFDRLGDEWGLARSQADRGRLALDRGEVTGAGPLLLEALEIFERLGHRRGMAKVTDSLAEYSLLAGHARTAAMLLAAAQAWRAAAGYISHYDDRRIPQRVQERLRLDLDANTLATLHESGRKMSPTDVFSALQEVVG